MHNNSQYLHVAVGVVHDGEGKILITQRPRHTHQGGLWEFPGGKLEVGEPVQQALARELAEEVGIEVQAASPLIKINHDYGDRRVLLDVWNVSAFSGRASGREGQALRWIGPEQFADFSFPAANLPIIAAAQLPCYYAILEGANEIQVIDNCRRILASGIKLLQFRVKSLPTADVPTVFEQVLKLCQQYQVSVLVNSDLRIAADGAQGLHLSSRSLLACSKRPAGYRWVSASCHNRAELKHAQSIGVDFVVIAPVLPTPTHPDSQSLGWAGLEALIEQANVPVFALGGLAQSDLHQVLNAGGQGVAGISAFLRRD